VEVIDAGFRSARRSVTVYGLRGDGFEISVDFGSSAYFTAGPWNNVADFTLSQPLDLVAGDGSDSGLRLRIPERFAGVNTGGVMAAGTFPQSAQRDSFFLNEQVPTATIELSGLHPLRSYTLTFFGSRADNRDMTTRFSSAVASVTLNASQNVASNARLTGLRPTPQGTLLIDISREPGAFFGFLGAMSISCDGVPLPLQHLDDWTAFYFPSSVGSALDLLADPDQDGLKNLVEFAGFTHPLQAGKPPLRVIGADSIGNHGVFKIQGQHILTTDVTTVVEVSIDMLHWLPAESHPEVILEEDDSGEDALLRHFTLKPRNGALLFARFVVKREE
jgi:hypothetical protein